jgi:cytochrome b561
MSLLLWLTIGACIMFFAEWMVIEVQDKDDDFRFNMWHRIGGIVFWPLILFWIVWGFIQGFLGR